MFMKSVKQRTQKSGKLGSLVILSVLREVGKWVRMDFFPKSGLGAQPETSIIKISNGSHLKTPAWKTVLPFWVFSTLQEAQ